MYVFFLPSFPSCRWQCGNTPLTAGHANRTHPTPNPEETHFATISFCQVFQNALKLQTSCNSKLIILPANSLHGKLIPCSHQWAPGLTWRMQSCANINGSLKAWLKHCSSSRLSTGKNAARSVGWYQSL